MPAWGWVLIGLGILAVLVLVAWQALARRRTSRLRGRFGPEYDRTVESDRSKRDAEGELTEREKRHQELEIRPLTGAARERYVQNWQVVQGRFVDDPRAAVAGADSLIQSVMTERGYPVEDFEQRAADVSVDHPEVVANYREGHRLSQASAAGSDSTEDLRRAMQHYRALFEELVESDSDRPIARDRAHGDGAVERGHVERDSGRTAAR